MGNCCRGFRLETDVVCPGNRKLKLCSECPDGIVSIVSCELFRVNCMNLSFEPSSSHTLFHMQE